MATYTISASSTVLINEGGENLGPDGLRLQFTVTGTNSAVLKVNTAPPGSAASYTDVAYLNQSLVAQSAGTAVTSSGLVYIPLASCGNDLYVTNTWTSGSVVITTAPANIGGGSGSVGDIPAGDITSGTFGANSGDTGTYAFPGTVTAPTFTSAGSATITNGSLIFTSSGRLQPISNGRLAVGNSTNAGYSGTNWGPSAAATTRSDIQKAVTGIANNTASTILTITIPNAAHSANVLVRATGSLGAGGAIGANEASATNCYIVTVTRTAGVNATAAISSAFGAAATAVAGAATCTAACTLAAVSGAVGATNTVDVQITIVRSGGSSTNHTAVVYAEVLNANATGVTIA